MPVIAFLTNFASVQEFAQNDHLRVWCPYSKLRHMDATYPVESVLWETGKTTEPLWQSALEVFDVHRAVGPPVSEANDWAKVREIYRHTHIRCSAGAIVRVLRPDALRTVPKRYPICPDPGPRWDPWAYLGRRVWLWGCANHRMVWERYCELKVVGVDVAGIMLPSIGGVAKNQLVYGGDLRAHRVSGMYEEDRVRMSVVAIRDFWRAASELYG